ncbi:MAG: hypothetical protein RSE54_05835 [Ruthenibacterium sp.]
MKLLFIIDRAHIKSDANINLVRGMLPYLTTATALTQAHSVRFLGHTAQRGDTDAGCFYFGMDEKVRKLFFSLAGISPIQKLLRLLCHPVLSAFGCCKAMHIDWITGAYRRAIEHTCADFCPDAVIAVAAPFYTAKALAVASIKCKKIIWMFDPWGTHYLTGGTIAKRQEKRCIKRVDVTFVPELLAENYTEANVRSMAFPGLLRMDDETERNNAANAAGALDPTATTRLYPQGKINLAFVGSLYADIRNPAPLLRLLTALSDERLQLTLVGGLYGEYSKEFHAEFDDYLAKHVTCVKQMDRKAALHYMQQADVLVNIGNTISNQLPSKIFEYFSTGRPVLNLKQLEHCPADGSMQKYPLSFTVDTTKPLTEATTRAVLDFLYQNAGKRLSYAQIEHLFPENTPSAVAKKLLAAVKGE